MSDRHDLELLLRGHAPILQIESQEEKRAIKLLATIATNSFTPISQWAATEGLKRIDIDLGVQRSNKEPENVLAHIKAVDKAGIYVLLDFEPYLQDPIIARFIKEIAMQFESTGSKLILLSHKIKIPNDFKHFVARFQLSLPDETALIELVAEEIIKWQKESRVKVISNTKIVQRIVNNLNGLSFKDARRLIRNAIIDDDAITESDLSDVMQAKYRLLNRNDVISFEYDTERFSNVGGMKNLKSWLAKREKVFLGEMRNQTLDRPRGLLLLGVQGCGKSLAAKAIAGIWNVPLLRFDFAALYDKYIGETESNLRSSLETAQVLAPCILWIDEIEKGISGGNDDGTSTRILGTFLTWLAENKENVFVVATANNINNLPPELIRKGRMDEIFFVDLPDKSIRKTIFSIHMKKRNIDIQTIDLDKIARASKQFSGSEIEQVVVSALYSVHENDRSINTEDILNEINATRPLAIVMSEQINQLRSWAAERTVPVD